MAILVLFLKVITVNVSIKRSAIDKTEENYFNLLLNYRPILQMLVYTVWFFVESNYIYRKHSWF